MTYKSQLTSRSPQQLAKIALAVLAGMGVAAYWMPSSIAQTAADIKPLDNSQSSLNQDPFDRLNNGDSYGGVLDMIHRAQLGTGRNLNEYITDQRQNMDSAADAFRRQQLERLRNQNQAAPVNPAPSNQAAPTTVTPTQQ